MATKEYEFTSTQNIDLLDDGDFRPSSVEVEPGHLYLRGEYIPAEGRAYRATLHVLLSEDVEGDTAEEILAAAAPYWDSWEIIPEPEYQFWRHKSGELFAVGLVAGKVVAAVHVDSEDRGVPAEEFDFREADAIDDGAWVEENRADFELVEA